jgi:hypothetical protein
MALTAAENSPGLKGPEFREAFADDTPVIYLST